MSKDYPQQKNGYDCGVFMCKTIQYLSQGFSVFSFTQEHITVYRRQMALELAENKLTPLS